MILIWIAGLCLFSGSQATVAQTATIESSETVAVITKTNQTILDENLPDKISFNAHIRPIMSNTCFVCHGPDQKANQSGLRLDSFEAAVDVGAAIEPGNTAESLVYERITDNDSPMPPAKFLHQLSDRDKALFKKWIEQGAKYESHWSYTPITRPTVPQPQRHADKVANEIDAFIISRLEMQGIAPSPPADKATLLRRLSLDLIGLPPTLEELAEFLADHSPTAYQKQVERLLASPHYGERMASQWLDIVRFSDTVGFHGDQNQRIFPYRDYVINSLNKNKPFDQFTREQIAGDLLENSTTEQLTATGLIRLNMMTREGGAQPAEYLAKYTADRVRMIGTAWLGATTGCCQCHNHKYDPLTIEDFYSMGAFFDDIRQWGVYTTYGYTPNPDLNGFTNDHPFPPELRIESESLRLQIAHLESAAKKTIANQVDDELCNSKEFRHWVDSIARTLERHHDGWVPLEIQQVESTLETSHTINTDRSILFTGDARIGDVVKVATVLSGPMDVNAIQIEVLPDDANHGFVGRSDDGHFSIEASFNIDRRGDKPIIRQRVRPRYVRIELESGQPLSFAEVQVFAKDVDGQPRNIASIGKATQSTTAYDGSAELAIDGNTDGNYQRSKSVTHTAGSGTQWWELDLGSEQKLNSIAVWNRTDGNYAKRLHGYRMIFLDSNRKPVWKHIPKFPDPSIQFDVPDEVSENPYSEPVQIEFVQADRFDPPRYNSGFPSRFIDGSWRSGPSVWQLPSDEAKLKHTAVFHLKSAISAKPGDRLEFQIKSNDVGRIRLSVSPLTRFVAGMAAADQELIDAASLYQSGKKLNPTHQESLVAAYYLATTAADKLTKEVREIRDLIADCRSGFATTMIAQQTDLEEMPKSRVLPRGNWQDTSGTEVEPATPAFLPQLPNPDGRRLTRLDLANWLTDENNPLTARHYVNRTWKHFFGSGLSNKLDDLGNQGEWPSHIGLVDWLAAEFRNEWDMKHIARLIVSSNTYKQQAAKRTDLYEIDPFNRLLAGQSARRLEAETIRDNALAIAGLLFDDFIGGPSVFPYQPDGHYRNLQFPNRTYTPSPQFLQYRRGVYTHWQRTFLHPMLVNFDAPSRDECVADRTRSNSPLQALTLLNDPQFVEAANGFATSLLTENNGLDFAALLDVAFTRAVARNASQLEKAGLHEFYSKQKEYYTENNSEIDQLLSGIGSFKPDRNVDPVEFAAWSQVCRVILNLHETITRF